jgi:hypothetical protein
MSSTEWAPGPGDSPLDVPSRPNYLSANSAQHLLGDQSAGNTPELVNGSDKPDPFGDSPTNSRQGSGSSVSHSTPADITPTSSTSGSAMHAPEINVIPTSPDMVAIPAFQPHASFSAPFDDEMRDEPNGKHVSYDYESQAKTSATAAPPPGMISRRSQRLKNTASLSAKPSKRQSRNEKFEKEKRAGGMTRKPFESTRLKGEIYKPWLEKRDPAQRWARWITIVSIILGIAICGVRE